ncbi:MAG: hypothetical protein ACJ8LL_08000, partial [Candidatus Udaeobacter sp.]
ANKFTISRHASPRGGFLFHPCAELCSEPRAQSRPRRRRYRKDVFVSVILLKIKNQTAEVNHPPLRGMAFVIRVWDDEHAADLVRLLCR